MKKVMEAQQLIDTAIEPGRDNLAINIGCCFLCLNVLNCKAGGVDI